ncbi:amidase [Nocardia salmonicida]|uniref:amidase n=1 Tax=Nocardia salmonicida TaxID=53431 RepID=UPI002E2B753F|nr:amidase [Nocardia salmonicida]
MMLRPDAPTVTDESAIGLAASIRAREVTVRAVIDAHIAVLERFAPATNAVVVDCYDTARQQADAADAHLATGPASLPPLFGVPITVKESLAVAGLPNTAGVVARKHLRPAANATVVQRVLDAGAIVLGLTNTSEGCMWIESTNRVYGRTNNVHDQARTAGGSSGGEGAAVGSGGSPLGLATDTLGSIRIPAFCNGVFGHRPSTGLLPTTGAWPPPFGVAALCSNGVIARRAADLMPLLQIMAGPDGTDPLIQQVTLGDPATTSLRGARVVLLDKTFAPGVGREVLAARDRAAAALADVGAEITRVPMPALRMIGLFASIVLAEETGISFAEIMSNEGADILALGQLTAAGGDHALATRLLALGELIAARLPGPMARRITAAAHNAAAEITETIGDGLLLHPTLTTVAPRHGRTTGRLWRTNTVAPFSLAGLPVTQVPLGRGSGGLPLGVQVVAGPNRDHLSIAAALTLEKAFGGWVRPRH